MSSTNKTVAVGVIGIGNMGKHHARIYSSLEGVRLAAISDIDDKNGRELSQKFGCEFYSDYRQMLRREDIVAVSIVVPTKLHKKVCLDVIRAGKHLLVEKPIAANAKEAKVIIKAAESKGLILMVGHIERFNPAVQELKRIIQKKELGDISTIIARRVGIFPPQIKDANVIIDLGVHDIDIISYLLNKQPESVFALARKTLTNKREDSTEIFLSYGKTSGFIQTNWITPIKIRTLSVTGSKGHAELNYITQSLEIYKSIYVKEVDDFGQFIIKFGDPVKQEIKIEVKEPLVCELKSFIVSVKEKVVPQVTGSDGLKALIAAEGAIKSLGKNKVIKL